MSQPITRITLFKIPREEDQKKVLDFYKSMPQKAIKVRITTFQSCFQAI